MGRIKMIKKATIKIFGLMLFCFTASEIQAMNQQEAQLKRIIPAVTTTVKKAGTIDYKSACSNCERPQSINERKSTVLVSKDNNQKIELTLLSEDDVLDLYDELAAREDIPYEFSLDGCYSRAHKMAKILAAKGITAGKAFIEGELYSDSAFGEVGWRYQVAPVVMIKKGNAIVPYVIDPSLFKGPVPQTEWKARLLSNSKSKFSREYYTNRFAYTPEDRLANMSEYSKDSLEDMDYSNRNFNKLLYNLRNK